MKQTEKTPEPNRAAFLLRALSLFFSVVPVGVCVLLYFPLWREGGALCRLSGFAALLLALCALPLFRTATRLLSSPAVWEMWLFAFLLFFLLSRIAGQMTVIAFTGFVGNATGAALWHAAERKNKAAPEKDA